MSEAANQTRSWGEHTYSTAVSQGSYNAYTANLLGKFDNVRLYWEDQSTRLTLLGPISELLQQQTRPVRVLDLGCGSGQGYENLTRLERDHLNVSEFHDWLLKEDNLEYLGLDLSEAMVAQGRANYFDHKNVRFEQADLNIGLGDYNKEEPFDIYYSAYGSLSHLERPNLEQLLCDISEHGHSGSLIVLDLLGQFSMEWPNYWGAMRDKDKFREYTMSYLYLGDSEAMNNAEYFPIRYWPGSEIPDLVQTVNAQCKGKLSVVNQVDRSILVGRHSDTQEFNPQMPPVRSYVNRLLEDHMRTNLAHLIFDPRLVPKDGPVTEFYHKYIECWNTLINFTQKRIDDKVRLSELIGWSTFPAALQFALMSMDRIISDINWMGFGDPRANILEPQLAYALQTLERNLQKGMGCGHGLLVILRNDK